MDLIHVDSKITQWHHDKNLIEGATDWSQSKKLLEEFIELISAQMPDASPGAILKTVHTLATSLYDEGRIKSVLPEDAQEAKLDSLGDQVVVIINIAERNHSSLETVLNLAYQEIKDRKGKMINGTFVKEEIEGKLPLKFPIGVMENTRC